MYKSLNHKFSVAPMLHWTDKHCRFFHRQLSRHACLYSEMVSTGAILHGKKDYLSYNEEEHPLVLQLGGGCPHDLGKCASIAEKRGYDAINLNVGCPSDRVKKGLFGVCLMKNAQLVADCVRAMQDSVSIPVTVKTRIGVDAQDSYNFFSDFIGTVAVKGGCNVFIIHARKALLNHQFSPKENLVIPPLDYQRVYRLKHDYPQLTIVLNGGITNVLEAKEHLLYLDGIMMGRSVYQFPQILCKIDNAFFDKKKTNVNPISAIRQLYSYIDNELSKGTPLRRITRHFLGLFNGYPGARHWRRCLSEETQVKTAGMEVIEKALSFVSYSSMA